MRFRFHDFELDGARFELRRGRAPVPLRPKAFDLLMHLVLERARVVPRAELVARVWGHTAVGPGSLSGLVNELRQALGERAEAGRVIRTVHARGYQFVAPVRVSGPAEAAGALEAAAPSEALAASGVAAPDWIAGAGVALSVVDAERLAVAGGAGAAALRRLAAGARSEAVRDDLQDAPQTVATDVVHVVGSSALGDARASRLGEALVAACVEARGPGAVGSAMPLPMRAWFRAEGTDLVAGGRSATGRPPGGPEAWAGLVSALARERPTLLVIDPFATAGGEIESALRRFLAGLEGAALHVLLGVERAAITARPNRAGGPDASARPNRAGGPDASARPDPAGGKDATARLRAAIEETLAAHRVPLERGDRPDRRATLRRGALEPWATCSVDAPRARQGCAVARRAWPAGRAGRARDACGRSREHGRPGEGGPALRQRGLRRRVANASEGRGVGCGSIAAGPSTPSDASDRKSA